MPSRAEGQPSGAKTGTVLELSVTVAALATIPLTLAQEQGISSPLLRAADWMIWSLFVAELVILFPGRNQRVAYLRRNVLGLAIVVLSFPLLPDVLSLVRLTRLARLGRAARILRLILVSMRGVRGLRTVLGRRGLVYVTAVSSLLVVTGGGLLSVLEPERLAGGGYAAGIWWAIVTASTVGYGDIAPTTVGGRLVALAVMLSGIGLISTLAASITAYFVEQEEGDKLTEIQARLDRIEAALMRLDRGVSARAPTPDDPGPGSDPLR